MKDARHLFTLAVIFVAVLLVFLVVRSFIVPRSFGEYGHYRGAAMVEIAAKPLHFAGHQSCETCHRDVAQTKASGMHAHVSCEACHGPLARHADDPSFVPAKLDTAVLCVRCHAASAAKPKWFPQVDAAQHAHGMACGICHHPHNPVIGVGAGK